MSLFTVLLFTEPLLQGYTALGQLHSTEPLVQGYTALGQRQGHHSKLNDLQDHVRVVFMIPKTTSIILTMDQDIMCCFKLKYLDLTFAKLHRVVVHDAELGV